MKEISIKKYVIYLFSIAVLIFVLNKLYIRTWILENDLPEFFLIVTYSIPNLLEAIIGTLLLTGILLQIRLHFNKKYGSVKNIYVYILAVFIASIYVISQELNFHSLGGNNVYDPYDIVASLIGLTGTFGIIQLLGFAEEETEIDIRNKA